MELEIEIEIELLMPLRKPKLKINNIYKIETKLCVNL
jgi:hypothetical protein